MFHWWRQDSKGAASIVAEAIRAASDGRKTSSSRLFEQGVKSCQSDERMQ